KFLGYGQVVVQEAALRADGAAIAALSGDLDDGCVADCNVGSPILAPDVPGCAGKVVETLCAGTPGKSSHWLSCRGERTPTAPGPGRGTSSTSRSPRSCTRQPSHRRGRLAPLRSCPRSGCAREECRTERAAPTRPG